MHVERGNSCAHWGRFPFVYNVLSPRRAPLAKARGRNAAHVFEIVVLYINISLLALFRFVGPDPFLCWPAILARIAAYVSRTAPELFPYFGGGRDSFAAMLSPGFGYRRALIPNPLRCASRGLDTGNPS